MKKFIMITIMGFVNLSSVAMQNGLSRGRSSVIIGSRTERPHVLPTSASTPNLPTDRKRQLKRSGEKKFFDDDARREAAARAKATREKAEREELIRSLVAGASTQANNTSAAPQANKENQPDAIALLKLDAANKDVTGEAGERATRVSWGPVTFEDEKPKE